MTEEEYARRAQYAGDLKPSMQRRRIGHDYTERCMYLITMTTEGRRPLLGQLVAAADGSGEASIEPSPLGRRVQEEWYAVTAHHPEVTVLAFQLMPDHLHGILFVKEAMSQHLGAIISGFKASTNRAYRQLLAQQGAAAAPQHREPAATAAGPSAAGPSAAGPSAAGPPPASAAPPAAGPPVGCAAALPQPPRRDRSRDNRQHGLLWTRGYNDHVLTHSGELDNWRRYIADNPRRLYLRRLYPDFFRVSFGLRIGPFECSAVGNRFLLQRPQRRQVQCSTHFYEEDILKAVGSYMASARGGAVLVSPSISEGEKRTMRTAFDAGLPLIYITDRGLSSFSKPGGDFFDACAEGRLLIVSPWPYENRRVPLTRRRCMLMNELARLIAEGGGEGSGGAALQPTGGGGGNLPLEKPKNSNDNEAENLSINSPCGNDANYECSKESSD